MKPKIGRLNNEDLRSLGESPIGGQLQTVIDSLNQESSDSVEIKSFDVTTGNPWQTLPLVSGYDGSVKVAKHYDGTVEMIGGAIPTSGASSGPSAVPWSNSAILLNALKDPFIPTSGLVIPGADSKYVTNPGVSSTIAITSSGQISINAQGQAIFHIRYLPKTNEIQPIKGFPIEVKTKFNQPPRAVVCLCVERQQNNGRKIVSAGLNPHWEYINSKDGPTIRIYSIQGLEYDCKQKVTVGIIGG